MHQQVLLFSLSVISDSLRPHRLWPARLLCPWHSPAKNTGMGCHFLLQGIFLTQGLNLCLLHCRRHWGSSSRWYTYTLRQTRQISTGNSIKNEKNKNTSSLQWPDGPGLTHKNESKQSYVSTASSTQLGGWTERRSDNEGYF